MTVLTFLTVSPPKRSIRSIRSCHFFCLALSALFALSLIKVQIVQIVQYHFFATFAISAMSNFFFFYPESDSGATQIVIYSCIFLVIRYPLPTLSPASALPLSTKNHMSPITMLANVQPKTAVTCMRLPRVAHCCGCSVE